MFMAAAVLAATAPGARASDTGVLPGYWQSVNKSNFVVSKTTEDRKCLTAAEVNAFMTNLSNRHYKCDYPTRIVGGGHLRLRGRCVDKHGTAVDVDATGEYAPEWFRIEARWSLAGLPIGGKASTEAHRISATCPAQSPPSGPSPSPPAAQPHGTGAAEADDAHGR